jgi:hypothetical protein
MPLRLCLLLTVPSSGPGSQPRGGFSWARATSGR